MTSPMDCQAALTRLYEYIDGELGDAEKQSVAAHLEACRPCLSHFEVERLFHEFVIRHAPRPQVRAEFKERILSRLADEQPRSAMESLKVFRLYPRFALAAVLIVGVGLGAAWLAGELTAPETAWATLEKYHHHTIDVPEDGIETADLNEAKSFVAAHFCPVAASLIPTTAPLGFEPHESCIMPWRSGRLVQLEFEDERDKRELSMFVIPAKEFQFTAEPRIRVGDRVYRTASVGCCRMVCWEGCDEYICALMGGRETSDLIAMAETIHAGGSGAQPDGSRGKTHLPPGLLHFALLPAAK